MRDACIPILAGAHRLVESTTRLRGAPGLPVAVGHTCCAEQAVVQNTLDACTTEQVSFLEGISVSLTVCPTLVVHDHRNPKQQWREKTP